MTALSPQPHNRKQSVPAETGTGGFLLIHAAPLALTPHIGWAVENVMRAPVDFTWLDQPARPGTQRTELTWAGQAGTAAQLASALRSFEGIFFEVTERASANSDAVRLMHTPALGICAVPTDVAGNFTVNEDRVRYAFEQAAGSFDELYRHFSLMLGQQWDDELEPLRTASGHNNITRITRRA